MLANVVAHVVRNLSFGCAPWPTVQQYLHFHVTIMPVTLLHGMNEHAVAIRLFPVGQHWQCKSEPTLVRL